MITKQFKISLPQALKLILLYMFLIKSLITVPFYLLMKIDFINKSSYILEISTIIVDLISNFVVIALLLNRFRDHLKLNFKLPYSKIPNLIVISSVISLMIGYHLLYNNSLGLITDQIPLPQFISVILADYDLNPYSIIISMIIIRPIYEEIIIRGIILRGFLNSYKPINAIILSSLIFGVSHLSIPMFINSFIGGLVLGILYYKTNSLFLCIIAHMTYNITAIMLEFFNLSNNLSLFILGTILFLGSAKSINRNNKQVFEKN